MPECSSRICHCNFNAVSKSKGLGSLQGTENGKIYMVEVSFGWTFCLQIVLHYMQHSVPDVSIMFQLVDCLNWRVQNEIDNILSVSFYDADPLHDFFINLSSLLVYNWETCSVIFFIVCYFENNDSIMYLIRALAVNFEVGDL